MARAMVTLKSGKSYHWLGYVFKENATTFVVNPQHIEQCKTNGLLLVNMEEDAPVAPLKTKGKPAAKPAVVTDDDSSDADPESDAGDSGDDQSDDDAGESSDDASGEGDADADKQVPAGVITSRALQPKPNLPGKPGAKK